ncbi:Signal recognition particle subunit SRP72 [Emydomyces testavorans]|uniref:Signal recognition particle subunit SRP72 n=1 Tax=Emydomyces testavorans TaxID=2070801 RepID=A0AAF0DNB9_9EURO|nr:Signal recognition particle subunit SRP72 [Emydomyces testavorans]
MADVQSLRALLQQTSIDDHDEIIKACNAILKKSKTDPEAQHIKAVALLKQDRFEDAIRVIEDGGHILKQRASLEWAYALYKSGKLDQAIEVAAASDRGRGAKHVEAQAAYRAEQFQRTKTIYEELYGDRSASAQEHTDLRINMTAADAQRQWAGHATCSQRPRPSVDDLEVFETTYNIACEYIARGELDQARQLLGRAKGYLELCKSSEDLSPEDKRAELLPIAVQELYVALRQEKLDDAEAIAKEISISDHSDRPFEYQSRILNQNSNAIELLVHKYDGVARSTSKLLSQQDFATLSKDINSLSVFNVAAYTRNKTGRTAINQTLSLLEKRPFDIGLILLAVKLYIDEGNVSSAVSALESFLKRLSESTSESDQEIRFNPGLISVLIALYKLQGRKRQINSELANAAAYWRKRSQQEQPSSLLRAAATSLLQSHDPSDLRTASEIFETLHAIDPTDRIATAGYVASHATSSPSRVQNEISTLSPIQDLISEIDVAALEAAGIPSTCAPTATTSRKRRSEADKEKQTAPKRKRIRKSRLPKDYDPDKKPDPERWLPLRDRSTYRPKGKKGKQKAAERTQGGVVHEKAEETVSPAAGVVQQKSHGGGGGGGAKKKKKVKGKR